MSDVLQSALKKGISFVRRFFSRRPQDSIVLAEDRIQFLADGLTRVESVRNLKHVTVDQSFLGLFGSNLVLTLHNGQRVTVRALDGDIANSLKCKLDERLRELLFERQAEALAKSSLRVREAYGMLIQDNYISAWQMSRWEEEFSDLKFLCIMDMDTLSKARVDRYTIVCRDALLQPGSWRKTRNDRWVKKELLARKALLDAIIDPSLTPSQREAVLRHDNRVLAVAGAGTGKTTTVIGKVSYLLETGICKPEEILLLSFSRGAVEELQERVRKYCGSRVSVKTFHSLGLEIITAVEGRKPAVFEQGASDDFTKLVGRFLFEALQSPSDGKEILAFSAYHFYPAKSAADFEVELEYLQHAKSHGLQTLNSEKVRSYEEQQIADWLFLNGIKYVYEAKYKGTDTGSLERRVYRPDFYLPDHDIYIEHFGVDRNDNTAPFVDRTQYLADMEWKRNLHARCGTRLLETFSYLAREGNLLLHLEQCLRSYGVVPAPITRDELLARDQLRFRLGSLAKLLSTALTLFKGDRLTVDGLGGRIERILSETERQRSMIFLKVFCGILDRYQAVLQTKGEVDFGDMITTAARYVESEQFRSPYKVIIVDEFQDISRGRAWFMNALLEQVDDSRLLCVGDDWQSIFRFTGSDVSLMTNYATQWPEAVRIDLNTTFRFNNKIQDLSSIFITKNRLQLRKQITCVKRRDAPAVHITDRKVGDIIKGIQTEHPGASYMVLNRYRFNFTQEARDLREQTVGQGRQMTIHGAKGRQADFIIVDNVEPGRYGLPTEMVDDPIIGLFLAEPDLFPNAEERRLFYVALTRACNEVWLRVKPGQLSCFAEELIRDPVYKGLVSVEIESPSAAPACPKCGGHMTPKTNRLSGQSFFGCVHYPRCRGTLPDVHAQGRRPR